MPSHSRWLPEDQTPSDSDWQPPPHLTRAERSAEQDRAAGGKERRRVALESGKLATASVELKRLPKGRRVYGYLRYSDGSHTVNRYIGEVTADSREQALKRAWDVARAKGLLSRHPHS